MPQPLFYVYLLRRLQHPRDWNGLTTDVWKAVSNLMTQLANYAVKSLWSLYLCTVDRFSFRVWMLAKVIKGAEIIAYTKQGIAVAAQQVTMLARDWEGEADDCHQPLYQLQPAILAPT